MSNCNPCSSSKDYVASVEFELLKKSNKSQGFGETVEKYDKIFSGYANVKQKSYYDNYNGGSNSVTRSSVDFILDTDFDDRITTDLFARIDGIIFSIMMVSDPNLNRRRMNVEIHRESSQDNV